MKNVLLSAQKIIKCSKALMAFCLYQIKHCSLAPRLKKKNKQAMCTHASFHFFCGFCFNFFFLSKSVVFYIPGSWGTPQPCSVISVYRSSYSGLSSRCWLHLIFQRTGLESSLCDLFLKNRAVRYSFMVTYRYSARHSDVRMRTQMDCLCTSMPVRTFPRSLSLY